ncbi:GGDEF domain-containing response regulator [Acidicapsa acidisoli]|uniref:GGDEF domain-containing response regulator n=1 Tax=Acidicapsa acidisoli TaxID=1615681 RepID=UPI0021E0E774|nr:diguanylate cyclase [Acidicapsa acidisoli]
MQFTSPITSGRSGWAVLLASPDPVLASDLRRILQSLGLHVETVTDGKSAIGAMRTTDGSAVILLDVRLPGVANGELLAAMLESGVRKRCAVALIADQVSDEWIARLREGAIDDIVPRGADAVSWSTHLSTMRRGHELYCELEQLRQVASIDVRHDRVTGALHRETMLTLLFRETDRVQRLQGSLSVVLFDIDDFGHWNKELGRDACDGLLREVADRTGRILRSYDLLGRTGKDEFLMALPGCSTINATMMAERLRMEVFGDPFLVKDEPGEAISVTLTACCAVASSRGRSPVVVLREAEQTLALAKRSGPGTIRCAHDSSLPGETGAEFPMLYPETEALA